MPSPNSLCANCIFKNTAFSRFQLRKEETIIWYYTKYIEKLKKIERTKDRETARQTNKKIVLIELKFDRILKLKKKARQTDRKTDKTDRNIILIEWIDLI